MNIYTIKTYYFFSYLINVCVTKTVSLVCLVAVLVIFHDLKNVYKSQTIDYGIRVLADMMVDKIINLLHTRIEKLNNDFSMRLSTFPDRDIPTYEYENPYNRGEFFTYPDVREMENRARIKKREREERETQFEEDMEKMKSNGTWSEEIEQSIKTGREEDERWWQLKEREEEIKQEREREIRNKKYALESAKQEMARRERNRKRDRE